MIYEKEIYGNQCSGNGRNTYDRYTGSGGAAPGSGGEDTGDGGSDPGKSAEGCAKGTETVSETADKEREPQEQAAIDAALADAKLTEEELTGLRIKKDRDDGKTVYEVELYVDAEEYSYEIDADTAKILEQDYEVEDDYDKEPDDPDAMTREDAVQIILDKVEGATEMDIRIKYERDDGKDIYEGSLVYEGTEYEFELNAKDGQILEWSEERY